MSFLILLDFSNAFDRVNHTLLIIKMKGMGFDEKLIGWVACFFKERRQRVVIGEATSEWAHVLRSVPQGSVLGPLLFLIYINDMSDLLKHFCKLFADDSQLVATIKDLLACELLQEDRDALMEWSIKWEMSFNFEKCKIIKFGNTNGSSLKQIAFKSQIKLELILYLKNHQLNVT